VREKPERARDLVAQRPVPDDTSGSPSAAETRSRTPFSGESRPA
jgi:hypothetical protein